MDQKTFYLSVFLSVLFMLPGTGCGKKVFDQGPAPKTQKSTQRPYTVGGRTYRPIPSATNYSETGLASWYGKKFHGRRTASGELYDMYKRTAAHKILPMQTWLTVTNLDNGKTTRVRVNDRGPFAKNRILDLSFQAAKDLGVIGPGTAHVHIRADGARTDLLPGPFYVQIGSFTIKENALKACTSMQGQGYAQSRIHPVTLGDQTFWQVHAGKFTTMSDAQSALHRLSAQSPMCFILAD